MVVASPKQLQQIMTRLNTESKKWGLEINIGKTVVMRTEKLKEGEAVGVRRWKWVSLRRKRREGLLENK